MSRERIFEFKPCPVCKETDGLDLLSEDIYKAVKRNDQEGMVDITCHRCHLSLAVYGFNHPDKDYSGLVDLLKEKWNSLPR